MISRLTGARFTVTLRMMMFLLVDHADLDLWTIAHAQTLSAYYLMDYINPVTHSVANTGKRAALIWSSVLVFEIEITALSGLGTAVVIAGVLLYNMATEVDATNKARQLVQVGPGKYCWRKCD